MIDEDGNDGALDLHLIDFEYAAPNYAAYDIGNHFYEMAGFECNWEDFPTIEQQVAAITTATWFIRNSTVSFSSFFTYSFFFLSVSLCGISQRRWIQLYLGNGCTSAQVEKWRRDVVSRQTLDIGS